MKVKKNIICLKQKYFNNAGVKKGTINSDCGSEWSVSPTSFQSTQVLMWMKKQILDLKVYGLDWTSPCLCEKKCSQVCRRNVFLFSATLTVVVIFVIFLYLLTDWDGIPTSTISPVQPWSWGSFQPRLCSSTIRASYSSRASSAPSVCDRWWLLDNEVLSTLILY